MPWFGAMRNFLAGIDLSDEQVEKIAEMQRGSFSKMAHTKIDMMESMQQLFAEMAKPQIDRARAAELKDKVKELRAGMSDLKFENMITFAEILTPEQRRKIRMKKIRQFLGAEEHMDFDESAHYHDE
jgi:Spy/CpxP family protein refolding chaperone